MPVVDLTGGVHRLKFEALTDARQDPAAIGENPEKRPPVSVRTSTDVSKFVSDAVAKELSMLGLELDNGGERVLSGEITQFWVKDTGSYDATVRVKFTSCDTAGAELWTGLVSGRGANWGRQLKAINYTETLTAAVLDFITSLARSAEFMKGLRKAAPTGSQ